MPLLENTRVWVELKGQATQSGTYLGSSGFHKVRMSGGHELLLVDWEVKQITCVRCSKAMPGQSIFVTICDECRTEEDVIWACFSCGTEFEGIETRCMVCQEPFCANCPHRHEIF